MLKNFIKKDIEDFVGSFSHRDSLGEITEAIYNRYAHFDQIGYAVCVAVWMKKAHEENMKSQL